jgi:acyl dehydratase
LIEPGQEYRTPPIDVSMARMLAFSGGPIDTPGWPIKNLHTDAAKAAEAGFQAPIASSIQAEAQAVSLLDSLFGEAWFTTGVLDLKIVKPLFPGDVFALRIIVRDRQVEGHGFRYELDVIGERTDGAVVVSGTAQVSMP